jgi:nucleoside-diphosphate-sugar epimerase
MSPGYQYLDPIYIDDVCDAFLVALKRLNSGQVKRSETYSVCSQESIQLRELVKIYENVSNTKLNVEWGGRPYRAREVMQPWSEGVTLPGWSPKVSIEDGIKMLLQSYV